MKRKSLGPPISNSPSPILSKRRKLSFLTRNYTFLESDSDDLNASLNNPSTQESQSEEGLLSQISPHKKETQKPFLSSIFEESKKYKQIRELLDVPGAIIQHVKQLENHPHKDFFDLCRRHMIHDNVILGWHGTKQIEPESLLLSGQTLDLRHSNKGLFGRGIYVAKHASYSEKYNYVYRSGNIRKIVLAECLVGKICDKPHTDQTLIKEPEGFNSVRGYKDGPKEMYILYQNHQVWPKYVVTYTVPNHPPPHVVDLTSTAYSIKSKRRKKHKSRGSKSHRNSKHSKHNSVQNSSAQQSYFKSPPPRNQRRDPYHPNRIHHNSPYTATDIDMAALNYKPSQFRCPEGHHQSNFQQRIVKAKTHPYYACKKCERDYRVQGHFGSLAEVIRDGTETYVPGKTHCPNGHTDRNRRWLLLHTKKGLWFSCPDCGVNEFASKAVKRSSRKCKPKALPKLVPKSQKKYFTFGSRNKS